MKITWNSKIDPLFTVFENEKPICRWDLTTMTY